MIFQKLRRFIRNMASWKMRKMPTIGSMATAISLRYTGIAPRNAEPITVVLAQDTSRELRNAGAVTVKKPENEHREDRPDGAERHETKAVGLRAAVASDVRYAETEREDERHGHGSGRHAAGVEGDAEKVLDP